MRTRQWINYAWPSAGRKGDTMDYQEQKDIEAQLGTIINSEWCYSWHWERNKYGGLTDNGWKQALKDGQTQLMTAKARYEILQQFIPKIEAVVSDILKQEQDEIDNNPEQGQAVV